MKTDYTSFLIVFGANIVGAAIHHMIMTAMVPRTFLQSAIIGFFTFTGVWCFLLWLGMKREKKLFKRKQ